MKRHGVDTALPQDQNGGMPDLPFVHDDGRTPNGATGRKPCRKHEWGDHPTIIDHGRMGSAEMHSCLAERCIGYVECTNCRASRDWLKVRAASRRGKSARRLGADQERRIERVYGPTKIGERGDPVDHIGRVWRWQSKATRADPPLWLARITEPTARHVPGPVAVAWYRMSGLYGDRRSVVIRSYVHAGTRTRDWLFVAAEDGIAELGEAIPYYTGWWVIPGDWWLDHFGRDEEA